MTFKVSSISGVPHYDSLPVAKITDYPLEQRDYKPFAQVSMCVSEQFLHLRMWAFEVNPSAESGLEAVLYLFRERPDTALAVAAVPDGDGDAGGVLLGVFLLQEGQEQSTPREIEQKLGEIELNPFNGEDLQGVYWGYTVDIPLALLEEWGGALLLNVGEQFPGNFFKTCDTGPNSHYGSFAPADFAGNCYLPPSMGVMEVVPY